MTAVTVFIINFQISSILSYYHSIYLQLENAMLFPRSRITRKDFLPELSICGTDTSMEHHPNITKVTSSNQGSICIYTHHSLYFLLHPLSLISLLIHDNHFTSNLLPWVALMPYTEWIRRRMINKTSSFILNFFTYKTVPYYTRLNMKGCWKFLELIHFTIWLTIRSFGKVVLCWAENFSAAFRKWKQNWVTWKWF